MEVKWIKIATDIFDNKKIKQIECLPDGDRIIVVWFKLLCLAGNTNDSGMVYITKDIPYTEQMLSIQFNRPLDIVQNALNVFQKFGMIHIVDDILHVSNWEKYQNIDGMERIKEQTRKRVEKHRNKNKLLQLDSCNVTGNVTVTQCNATDKDIEEDIDKKENKNSILLGAACADSKPEPSPVLSLVLNDKSFHPISQPQIDHWKELYPAVDILQELRKMQGWLESNPAKRKTKRGISAFITSWLSKAQDKGNSIPSEHNHSQYDKYKTTVWI